MYDDKNEITLSAEGIEAIASLSDQAIVDKLWRGDDDAWGYVYLNSVLPIIKKPVFYRMIVDRKLSKVEIYGLVYEKMISQRKLSLYAGGRLKYWIRYYVIGVIVDYCRKNDIPVSPDVAETTNEDKEAPIDLPKDELEFAQRCFKTLWRKNPMRAYVHLLKAKHDLSILQIQQILNISSKKNTAKIAERALSDMCELRQKLSAPGGRK